MGEVVFGIDFRAKRKPLTPQQELERLACELMDVLWTPHDRAISEAKITTNSPDKEPA